MLFGSFPNLAAGMEFEIIKYFVAFEAQLVNELNKVLNTVR